MNFVNGKTVSGDQCESILKNIDEMLMKTLRKPPLDINTVINACDRMVKNIDSLDAVIRLSELGVNPRLVEMYKDQIKHMLNAEAIRKRLSIELGGNFDSPRKLTYMHSKATAIQTVAPLGVLFHITAGNVDGLPFISLLEGLLTGNINIVKLPRDEGGVTVSLLEELVKIEPAISEYVYIFDYSAKDVNAMKTLAAVADAIVVWGGDDAVKAVRAMAEPNTKIIEWGHKISFAYVTKDADDDALIKLATHICLTNQLYCSSCQGVFFDTDDMGDIYDFCESFLPVLERVSEEITASVDPAEQLFIRARVTLDLYHRQIEDRHPGGRVFNGKHCSVSARTDSALEPSAMFRNIWVKPLKRDAILNLRRYKSYLQTAALICGGHEYAEISRMLLQTGLVKISDGLEMSNYAFGEAHDGEFTLSRYTKRVSVQNMGV